MKTNTFKRMVKHTPTLNIISGLFYGLISFLTFSILTGNPFVGLFFAIGAAAMPFLPMTRGILGTGAAGLAGEQTPEEKMLAAIELKIKNVGQGERDFLKGEIATLAAELKSLNKDGDEATKKEVIRLASELKAIKEAPKEIKKSYKSFADNIIDAYKLLKKEDLLAFKDNKAGFLQLKSATTMSESNIDAVGTNSIPFTLSEDEPGLTRVSRRNPFILQLCNTGITNKAYVQWAEQRNPDGGASTTAQGAAKSAADFDIQEVSARVEKITAYIKVSKEMLDDVDFMAAEIRNELMELVSLKLDAQILGGDGSTPNLNGIITQASTFAGTPFVNAVDYATRWDVLRVAINQIMRASGGDSNFAANFMPNYIILHPDDATALELTKTNSFGQYVIPPFASATGQMISGCTVIVNPGMTSGTFLVGDFTKANVRMRESANISIGYDGNDFTNNLVTMLCETRAVAYIKGNHTNAFVYGVFASAITSLKDAKS